MQTSPSAVHLARAFSAPQRPFYFGSSWKDGLLGGKPALQYARRGQLDQSLVRL